MRRVWVRFAGPVALFVLACIVHDITLSAVLAIVAAAWWATIDREYLS